MTFRVKTRGDSSAPIMCEYACPEHGVFDELVARDIPDSIPCPRCGASSSWTPSAPRLKFKIVTDVHRGKSDEKPHPMACDTEALADGMDLNEWKAKRAAAWRSHDYDEWKAKTR